MATKGEPFSDAILQARDRNEAFAALLAATLDKAAVAYRQATNYGTARRDLEKFMLEFRSAARLSQTFAKDGSDSLLDKATNFFIKLSSGPASKLGRMRQRLQAKRVKAKDENSGIRQR